MENQTRFNLTSAIENWRQELASQSKLTVEVRRELETHLGDTVTEFQRRGLNDEESFWLARRRVGHPQQLGEEFVKVDPARAGREKVLWIAAAFFAMYLWQNLAQGLWAVLLSQHASWVSYAYPSIYLPVAWLAVSAARGGTITKLMAWRSLIRSRRRFFGVACLSVVACQGFNLAMMAAKLGGPWKWAWGGFFWTRFLNLSIFVWPGALIALIIWLLPADESRTMKRA